MFAPATTTHATLLARIADPGDPTAWGEFCAQYEEMIRAFARRQGVVGANADDIVQEVLLSLTKALPGFEYNPAKGKFRSYLKTVVVRAIIRRRQREFGVVQLGDVDEASRVACADEKLDAAWEEEWRQQHLRRAMRTVEAEFNATDLGCFRAYVVEGEDTEAVAKRFGVSASQVYGAKHRILARLKALIAVQVEDEG
ncbi:MAG TPA: sigma-70 family RNA polymerase sigma factor [Phycisphaerae bacterium]|nr:sigma-70 family RNA polymerase sigma factor [Phycisphaerae bacterium]